MNRRAALSFAIPSAWALVSATAWPAWAQGGARLPLATAINRTGRMRALSQRLAKTYIQTTLNVLPERARDILLATQGQVSRGLTELLGANPPADVTPLLKNLESRSQALFALTSAAPRPDSVTDVVRLADAMLDSAEDVTRAYEKNAPQASVRVVNVAGRQRMLSQRAARSFFLLATPQPPKTVRAQLEQTRKEFSEGLAYLQASPVSTPTIRNELELARSQWLFFDSALKNPTAPDTLQTVATTSERVYEVMDNLTALYDTAVRELFA
jgi:hypothetical protein